ncbi:ThuA domain-containing protein [Peterkaempfera bronchialis]|uniref:1,4-beta-xylanase n=1 Tax=Peterkaempfera bronchialis TaxID=2126346 RepID=A0A345T4K5_9ACTN|nr:ThuA domain-containing protein [Peterkaempfera bronchialis]AXI80910.1 1,4-beta-xylanase [Peterkaempfera bronchialis]
MLRTSTAGSLPRMLTRLLALCALLLGLAAAPGSGTAQAASAFKVIAFYNGTYDAAHINFVQEANRWFPQAGAQYGFTYTATNNWDQLNTANLKNYQVVLFLDDAPHSAAQRSAFQQYVQGGGGWMGFHVSAFTTDPGSWSWYYNDFLGTGSFKSNTWGPTSVTLRTEDRTHPATSDLPATFTSSVSEWYSWTKDLRQNPNIDILASIDPSSFPVGTDPNQSWYSGYYPILWTNRAYRMLYANFGHNAMDYGTNTGLSSTFASDTQNRFVINGLRWLARVDTTTPPGGGTARTGAITGYGAKCVDVAAGSSANGTAVQLYDCNGTTAQQWTVGSDGSLKALGKCLDVTAAGTANGTKVQLYDCNGTAAQKWTASGGQLVNTGSGRCLDATGPSSANGTRLQIWDCTGGSNQKWTLPA